VSISSSYSKLFLATNLSNPFIKVFLIFDNLHHPTTPFKVIRSTPQLITAHDKTSKLPQKHIFQSRFTLSSVRRRFVPTDTYYYAIKKEVLQVYDETTESGQ
jgi:hypothetical protein